MITTDIIIILYGHRKDLDICVESVEKNCQNYELHIIDNNSPNNIGFTKAVNKMIQIGKAPYIWLLNQDAIIKDQMAQQALIERFSYGEQVGITGSMQRDKDDPDIIRHCGTIRAFPGGIHKGGRVSMGHGSIPEKQTWVNFASAMIRRSMVKEIGLLDESMFLLYSDSSYCYTARANGYDCWYEPRSQVLHKLNASKTVTEWHQKDMIAFMKKWGITQTPEGHFIYSDLFARLDMFP